MKLAHVEREENCVCFPLPHIFITQKYSPEQTVVKKKARNNATRPSSWWSFSNSAVTDCSAVDWKAIPVHSALGGNLAWSAMFQTAGCLRWWRSRTACVSHSNPRTSDLCSARRVEYSYWCLWKPQEAVPPCTTPISPDHQPHVHGSTFWLKKVQHRPGLVVSLCLPLWTKQV